MKVCTRSFVAVSSFKLICASILMLGASVAFAEPALVITDFKCVLIDGNGGISSGVGQVTKANNPGGNAVMKCRGSDVPNDTGTTVKWENKDNPYGPMVRCTSSDLAASTYNWKITVDSDGNGVMTCKFRDLF